MAGGAPYLRPVLSLIGERQRRECGQEPARTVVGGAESEGVPDGDPCEVRCASRSE